MANIKSLFRLYKLYARMDLNWFLQDSVTCIIVILSELLTNIASMLGILLLSVRFNGVGGLNANEVLFMLGFFEMADGFTYMMFGGFNVLEICRRIARGQLDHMLIQPRPIWMQLMGEGFMPVTGSSGFIVGVILTVVACIRMNIGLTAAWILSFILYLLCHMAIKIGQSYLYAAPAFYKPVAFEEIDSLILGLNNQIGKYPLAGLPQWALIGLTTVLPVGLMAYVPSLALLGKLGKSYMLALPIAVAAVFMTLGIYFFRKGMRHYAQYSCTRYREIGHRN